MMLKKYADDNGFTNTVYYVDDGVSGTTFDREGFKAMMDDVEAGKGGTVITKDLSRLGRDYADKRNLFQSDHCALQNINQRTTAFQCRVIY